MSEPAAIACMLCSVIFGACYGFIIGWLHGSGDFNELQGRIDAVARRGAEDEERRKDAADEAAEQGDGFDKRGGCW